MDDSAKCPQVIHFDNFDSIYVNLSASHAKHAEALKVSKEKSEKTQWLLTVDLQIVIHENLFLLQFSDVVKFCQSLCLTD